MPTIIKAKNDVYDALTGLGYNPTNLLISELITESDDKSWKMSGEFRGGFMGEILKFEIKYFPETGEIGNIKVFPNTSQEGYA